MKMAGMFLRAVNKLTERVNRREVKSVFRESKEERIRFKGGKMLRVGAGHIFYHPDKKRAEQLLEVGQGNDQSHAIVTAPTDKEVLIYIRDCLQGSFDRKTSKVLRAPIAVASLDPMVQAFWADAKKRNAIPKSSPAKVPGAPELDDVAPVAAGEQDEPADPKPERTRKPRVRKPRKPRK